jgi:hypothetical protein
MGLQMSNHKSSNNLAIQMAYLHVDDGTIYCALVVDREIMDCFMLLQEICFLQRERHNRKCSFIHPSCLPNLHTCVLKYLNH